MILPTKDHSMKDWEEQLSLKVVTLQKMNLENELCKATKCANSNSIGTSLSGAFMGGGRTPGFPRGISRSKKERMYSTPMSP